MTLLVDGDAETDLRRERDHWVGEVRDGAEYGVRAVGPEWRRFDPGRLLIDPWATEVAFSPQHTRAASRPGAANNIGSAPRAVARSWPAPRPQRPTSRPLVVDELHVRGMTRRRDRPDAGTYRALADELPRLAELGVSVVELLPVHQFDPGEDNYWGYMPLVFGAVHRQYAATADAATELADLVTAAHEHDIEVWIDVVFNHSTEEDEHGPTYNLRGLADRDYYVVNDDGSYVNEAGTGNIIDAASPAAQRLIMEALDRFADLGIDGFRFDLASVLARDPAFVRSIGDWAERRGVRLIAEPWDIARYMVGRSWPDRRWMQWNDRFRDDMRGFLRGEPGLVPAVIQRVQASPDLFDSPATTVNFLTAHDGFTMYDLVAYDRKHNDANGWNGADGPDENRSWNCGWEGDVGVPESVMSLRRRQLRNVWTLLALSHGTPMFVAGDEFARTQHGNNNPYRLDDETSWVDWQRRDDWGELEEFARRMLAFRAEREVFAETSWWSDEIEWFGTEGGPDLEHHSRSVAWHLSGLYVMANMWWEPLDFAVQAPGRWQRTIDTTLESGFAPTPTPAGTSVTVGARSIVVLTSP
jgi:isoamylase